MNSSAGDNPIANTGHPLVPPVELFHSPRLGIIHLLAWIAVTAVLLKLSQAVGAFSYLSTYDFPRALRVYFVTVSIIYMLLHAAGVVGTAVILHARLCGITGRLQAGHWMVVITSIELVLLTALHFSVNRLLEDWFGISSGTVLGLTSGLLSSSLWLIAAMRCREAFCWKVAFAFLAVLSATMLFAVITRLVFPFLDLSFFTQLVRFPIGPLLTVFIVSTAVLRDYFRRVPRDWLHGLGVAMVITFGVLSVANFLVHVLLY